MILLDIYDMCGWWTLIITLQVAFLSSYFVWGSKKNRKRHDPLDIGKPITWKPAPLVDEDVIIEEPPIMGKIDENVLNLGATSFLDLDKDESIKEEAMKALRKYGVGSCGPRGFYGTIDVHLELEECLAEFLEVEETCVYSFGFSTIASAIPSYAKRGDIIFVDEKVNFAIQKGMDAARGTVRYFNHNDTEHLEQLLSSAAMKKELNPRRKAFLIIEGIYYNTGEMCPLPKLVELAQKYKLRIILDESLTIGVLGSHGRGITEHLGVPAASIELRVGSLEHALAGGGGFCAGTHYMVEHQRLSGLGYCFSASLPPLLARAGIAALGALRARPALVSGLQERSRALHRALRTLRHYRAGGDPLSPVHHVYIRRELTDRLRQSYLRNVAAYCLEAGVALSPAAYLRDVEHSCPEPSIRVAASVKMTDDVIAKLCALLDEAYEKVGPRPELQPVA